MKNLILVHGFLGSSLNWGPVLGKLRAHVGLKDWNFSAVDLLGHAYRPVDDKSRTALGIDEVSEDLNLQVPPGSFYALGHSFGLRPLLRFGRL